MCKVSDVVDRTAAAVPHHVVCRLRCRGRSHCGGELRRPRILDFERYSIRKEELVPFLVENRLIRTLHTLQLITLGHTHIELESFDLIEQRSALRSWSLDETAEDDERDQHQHHHCDNRGNSKSA